MQLLKFRFKKNKSTKKNKVISRSEWIQFILDSPEHQWINENRYIQANFLDFFEALPKATLVKMVKNTPTIFVPSSGRYSCAIDSNSINVILVFPELMALLKSTAISNFKAILAHELGHVMLNHGKRKIKSLDAQIEADLFAAKLGFVDDLENFLLDMPESIEKRVRLSYLTSFYFS